MRIQQANDRKKFRRRSSRIAACAQTSCNSAGEQTEASWHSGVVRRQRKTSPTDSWHYRRPVMAWMNGLPLSHELRWHMAVTPTQQPHSNNLTQIPISE